MKLQDQICSLDWAKKLKEIGVNQESLFYYQNEPYNDGEEDIEIKIIEPLKNLMNVYEITENHPKYSAFTATELLSLLPNSVCVPNAEPFDHFKICIRKFISVDESLVKHNNFILNYECDTTEATGERAWLSRQLTGSMYDPNLANVCAEMLVYLKSGGLMPQ